MTPWLVRLWRPLINRELRRGQKIVELDVGGQEHVERALKDGAGVMVTPNHSFHYDSYVHDRSGPPRAARRSISSPPGKSSR